MGHNSTRNGIAALVAGCAVAALTPAAPAAATPIPATAIRLERTGGFAGNSDLFTVDRSTTGGGRALRMAGRSEFRRLHGSYQSGSSCCDRFFYRITVNYRDGHRKSVTTLDGETAPRILWDVIAEVERVSAHPQTPAPAGR